MESLYIALALLAAAMTQARDCQDIRCQKGYGWDQSCYDKGTAECRPCLKNKYQDDNDAVGLCKECRSCSELNRNLMFECKADTNTACGACLADHFGETCTRESNLVCHPCKHCSEDYEHAWEICDAYRAREHEKEESGLSGGAIAGIVSSVVVFLLLIGAIWAYRRGYVICRRKEEHRDKLPIEEQGLGVYTTRREEAHVSEQESFL